MWNKCTPPIWFDEVLKYEGNVIAERAFPNEVCGFFVEMNDRLQLYTFRGESNPYWCSADPNEVIQFAYFVKEKTGNVVASFHTHPTGGHIPSKRDDLLSMWTNMHFIWVRQDSSWNIYVFHT